MKIVNWKMFFSGIILLTLVIIGWVYFASADVQPVIPAPIKPIGVKCNGEIIMLPPSTQLPISCDDARAIRDGNYCAVEIQKIEKRLTIAKKKCGKKCQKI